MFSKNPFVVLALHTRIALLDFAEQALFCSEKRAFSVCVNRSTFQHNSCFPKQWPNFGSIIGFSHKAPDLFITLPIRIFRPRIKPPLNRSQCHRDTGVAAGTRSEDKSAPRIPRPDPVRRPAMKPNISIQSIRQLQNLTRTVLRSCIVDDEIYPLMSREIANDL